MRKPLLVVLIFVLGLMIAPVRGEDTAVVNKILIVYGSFAGSTKEIAEHMGNYYRHLGISTEVTAAGDFAGNPADYDLIVIGSAIRMGASHQSVKKFVENYRSALVGKPVAVFAVCMSIVDKSEAKRKEAVGYTDKVEGGLMTTSKAVFAGKIDYRKLSWFDATMCKLMGAKEEDRRDWPAIDEWCGSLISSVQ
jgi:menaquinone-dependent protoporphyrinogen oxidase